MAANGYPLTDGQENRADLTPAPRARRFDLPISLRYRRLSAPAWHAGRIENISRSGVFFHGDEALAPETPVELAFTLPAVSAQAPAHVVCRGHIVRAATAGDRRGLAVAIRHYRLGRDATAS
jgi:hypothetical protein